MTNSEIETLIDYYGMVKEGDRIRITKHLDEAQAHLQGITAAKPRIMAYWVEKAAARAEEAAARAAAFYRIPGVRELEEAREAMMAWHIAMERAFESESGIFPAAPDVDIDALEANKLAAWALEVKARTASENYEIANIATRAYDALCSGQSPEKTKEIYDNDISNFVDCHFWD